MQGVKRGNMPLVKGQKVATNLLKGRKQSIIDPMKDLMLVMPQPFDQLVKQGGALDKYCVKLRSSLLLQKANTLTFIKKLF